MEKFHRRIQFHFSAQGSSEDSKKAGFSLPPSKPMVNGISCGAGSVEVAADFPDNKVSCCIDELRDISLEIMGDKDCWRSMMASHHPRGWSRTPEKADMLLDKDRELRSAGRHRVLRRKLALAWHHVDMLKGDSARL